MKTDKPTVAFAFYRNGKLLGYRQDTFGSIGDRPKLYSYDREQVEVVIRNVTDNVLHQRPEYVDEFKKRIDPRVGAYMANSLRNAHNLLTEGVIVEMRVVRAPDYEWCTEYVGEDNRQIDWPIYPFEAVQEWLRAPESHDVFETHFFGADGLIRMQ